VCRRSIDTHEVILQTVTNDSVIKPFRKKGLFGKKYTITEIKLSISIVRNSKFMLCVNIKRKT